LLAIPMTLAVLLALVTWGPAVVNGWWFPLALLTPGLFGVIGVVRLIRAERAFVIRRQEGLCVNCGYDMRGTPDRCPECGTIREKGDGEGASR
jgi:hypothetical protein